MHCSKNGKQIHRLQKPKMKCYWTSLLERHKIHSTRATSGHRHVFNSLELAAFWLKMPLYLASHCSPFRNCIISLINTWLFHCEGVTGYEPKTSFGSFWKWFSWGFLPGWDRWKGRVAVSTSGWKRERWRNPTQVTKALLAAGSAWGTHMSQKHYTRGCIFLCPQVFPLIILLYT